MKRHSVILIGCLLFFLLPGRSDHIFAQSPDTVASSIPYHSWFDENHSNRQSGNIGNGIISLDVSSLNEGVHSVNVQVGDGLHAQLWRQIFYKLPDSPDSTYHVSTYHCWFDEDNSTPVLAGT